MKVAYISNLPFADADFPLIREMQRQGVDVYYFIYITPYSHRATIADIAELHSESGIFPAEIYPEFQSWASYLDLKKVFVVNSVERSDFHPLNLKLMLGLLKKISHIDPDVVQITWPPRRNKFLLYRFRKKMVLTLHDPFPHSGKNNREFELCRKIAFRWIPKIILLNGKSLDRFCTEYHVERNRVQLSSLGCYDCIRQVVPKEVPVRQPYILFFGLIAPYKGIENLIAAMDQVHLKFPEVNLLIAGGGKIYFAKDSYEGKAYIEIQNRYIPLDELAFLLKNSLFAVCPYKDATQSGVVQTAFALNVPLVATDVGNFSEAIEDEKTGMIVPAKDSDFLAKTIGKLLENPELLQAMKETLKQRSETDRSWAKIVQEYLSAYKDSI